MDNYNNIKDTNIPSVYYKWCDNIKFRGIDNKKLKVPKNLFNKWVIDFIDEARRRAEAIHEKILTPEQVIAAIICYNYNRCKLAQFKIIHKELKIKKNSSAQLFKKEIEKYKHLIKYH